MGKEILTERYRVEVYPRPIDGGRTWQRGKAEEVCNEIAARIYKEWDGIERVTIAWDETAICEICGYAWAEGPDGEPQCCDGSRREWREERGVKK